MLNLVPMPQKIEKISEEKFMLSHASVAGDCLLEKQAIENFLSYCSLPSGEPNIIFETDLSLDNEEYTLETADKILIRASSPAGQLYALQTLKQIIFQCNSNLYHLFIKDKPTYKLRGFMLDTGRYFFPVSDVKK